MTFLQGGGYNGINHGINVCHFLAGIDESSTKTTVQICASSVLYCVQHWIWAFESYLYPMVQKDLAAKKVEIAAIVTEVNTSKLKKKDSQSNPSTYEV